MTAVVGLLNKRGVAIAADSAVTRSRGRKGTKCTKNGSKMLRLSNAVPVSVMLTGNGDYICNPWDVIVRRYRQQRGDIQHATVEACMHDFFLYIADTDIFWNETLVTNRWINNILDWIFETANDNIDWEIKRKKDDGTYVRPKGYLNAFLKQLKIGQRVITRNGKCPQFESYTIEQFREYAKPVIDDYFNELQREDDDMPFKQIYPKDFLDAIREEVEVTLMEQLTRCMEDHDASSTLVFSGYGSEQEYPSLVAAHVCEGINHRVNYYVDPKNIVCISDERPVAYCPFAQRDVMMSLIRGQHRSWLGRVMNYTEHFYEKAESNLFSEKAEEQDLEFQTMLSEVKCDDIIVKFNKSVISLLDKNQREWLKTLEQYDIKSMAALAQSLIDLTGFQRILTFEQEGVGGPVDVAVITKNDGFTWLSRKSWYHHKDVNGMYGSMGI